MKNKWLCTIFIFIVLISIFLIIMFIKDYFNNTDITNETDIIESESNYIDSSSDIESPLEEAPTVNEKVNELIKIEDINTFNMYLKNDKNKILVLGQTGCSHCQRFIPVLENAVNSYNIEILYIDLRKLSSDDYNYIINSDIIIPSKCTNSGKDETLKYGFGTPLTLFINSNKSIDCLRGYNDMTSFKVKLKELGIIK